jgi:hypothetical protein
VPRRGVVVRLIAVLTGNAAFDAIGVYPLAEGTEWGQAVKRWTKDDLDRLGFPEQGRFVFPIVKSAAAMGLALGLRWPSLGRLTAAALAAYFVLAVGFHVRAKDRPDRFAAAVVMLAWSLLALGAFGPTRPKSRAAGSRPG